MHYEKGTKYANKTMTVIMTMSILFSTNIVVSILVSVNQHHAIIIIEWTHLYSIDTVLG